MATPVGSAAAASEPAAVRLLTRAETATRALHSYAFTATETVASVGRATSRLTGRFVRGQGIAYDLVTGSRHTQVVRVARGTYVRAVPGRWARLAHARPVADPTASLLAVLHGLTGLHWSPAPSDDTVVQGRLPAPAATRAGIPTDGRPADVTVTADARGRVTAVTVSTSVAVGARSVTVTLLTRYTGFDRGPAVRPPV